MVCLQVNPHAVHKLTWREREQQNYFQRTNIQTLIQISVLMIFYQQGQKEDLTLKKYA